MGRSGKTLILGVLMLCAAVGVFGSGGDESGELTGLSGFRAVANTTPAEVVVRVGEDYSVSARGDRQVLNRYTFDISGDELRIRIPWRPWYIFTILRKNNIYVEITMPEINSVRATGSGDVRVEGQVRGDRLSLRTTGSGNIDARGRVDDLEISITGSGDVDFSGVSDRADLDLNSSGDLFLELDARTVTGHISGSGDISIRGKAEDLELKISSSGTFEGDDFSTESANITLTGSGNAMLNVDESVTARLTASGDLILGGSPTVESTIRGSGRVVNNGL